MRNAPVVSRKARLFAVASLCLSVSPIMAQERWAAMDGEARAALPAPRGSDAVTGGALSCEAQRWTLHLDLDGPHSSAGAAVLAVNGRTFELFLSAEGGSLVSALPRDALEPLKDGIRMEVILPGDRGTANFPLRGSRVAITEAEERCTLRDMSAYTPITFTPYSSHANLARGLRAKDIEAFAASTASQPDLTMAMAELGAGRRLLFTRLCGSSWYYGVSGCNITGFATGPQAQDAETGPEWRAVYDTESVHLHLDPKSLHDGWPDIVTLPARGGGAALVWRWDGDGYALDGELPEDDEPENALNLRPSQD